MDQSYYYTLSTIAQSAAAIIALGGAIIIFKINHIVEAINNYKGRIIELVRRYNYQPGSKYYTYSNNDLIKEFIKLEDILPEKLLKNVFEFYEGKGLNMNEDKYRDWAAEMSFLLLNNHKKLMSVIRLFKLSIVLLTTVLISSIYHLGHIYKPDISYLIISIYSILAISLSIFLYVRILLTKEIK